MLRKISLLLIIFIPIFIFAEEHIKWYGSYIDTTYLPLPAKRTHLYSWTRAFRLSDTLYEPESLYVHGIASRWLLSGRREILMDREKWQWTGVAEICSVGVVVIHLDTIYPLWVEEGYHQVVFISPMGVYRTPIEYSNYEVRNW